MDVTENVMENGSLPGGDQDMPRDDEMQAFHNQIRAVDAEKLEFVGDKVGLPCFFTYIFFSCKLRTGNRVMYSLIMVH